jgi:hypothetical protein
MKHRFLPGRQTARRLPVGDGVSGRTKNKSFLANNAQNFWRRSVNSF